MSTTGNKLLALIAIAAIVGACSGSATTAPASAAPASAAPASAAPASAAPASAAPASAAPDGTLPKPELTSIKIGIGAITEPAAFAPQLALMSGIFAKYGLQAEVIGFEGDGKTLTSMLAGQIDLTVGAVGAAISTQMTDTPLVLVAMGRLTIPDALWCRSAVKTAADVVGEQLAISTYGGTSHGSALLALKGLGLTVSQVTITQVGGESARVAALKAGSVGCIVASRELDTVMSAIGANKVIDLQTAAVQFGNAAAAVRKDWLAKYPNTALVAVASILEAENSMWLDTPGAVAKFTEFTQMNEADATAYMAALVTTGNRTMMWTDEALMVPKETLASVKPELAGVDLSKCSDYGLLQKLKDIGFYNKIGDPLLP